MSSDIDTENLPAVFNGGYIHVCFLCKKISATLDELKCHLDESHDEFQVDDLTLDGPQYKVRKLKFYQDKLSMLNADLRAVSIIDVIEAPLSELNNVLDNFNREQRELCMQIRRTERPLCTFSNNDDDLLPPDDPLEIEYQMLKAKHASKLREYEENLNLERLKKEELRRGRERLAKLRELHQ